MKKRKTLVTGETLIDWIVHTNGSIKDIDLYEKKIGGAPLNVSIAINLFGGDSIFYSSVGDDSFGLYIKDKLKDRIDTSNIIVKRNKSTTMAFVSLDKDGDRSFEFNRGADKHLQIRDISKIDMKKSDIYLFAGAMPLLGGPAKTTYDELLEYGVKNNKFIAFDPNYREFLWEDKNKFIDEAKKYIEKSNIIKIGTDEMEIVTGTSDEYEGMKKLRTITKAIILVTKGKDGASVMLGDKIYDYENQGNVVTVDTTGAGDAFFGTILGLLSNEEYDLQNIDKETIDYIIEKALFIASMSTTKKGALMENPGFEDLIKS